MRQHTSSGSDAFKFDIASPSLWSYAPGDTIIGHLVRKTPIVTPEATITLSLIGRAKVKLVFSSQNSKTVYRDEAQLVNSRYTVFKGPLHLAEGGDDPLTWPVSVDIPQEPQEFSRQGRDPECSLVPLNKDHPGHHILPGSFYSRDASFGNPDSTCFVEYYLIANMRYQYGGSFKSHEAICPISLRHPISDSSKLNVSTIFRDSRLVRSQRLLPGMENADLSFKEHMQKFFSSSKVPSFKYSLRLTVPTAVQLNNAFPIPLYLEIVPISEGTSENLKEIPQNIHVTSMQMILRSYTQCIAPGNYVTKQHSNLYDEKSNLDLQSAFAELKSPVIITTGKGNEPAHIGELFQLTLEPSGLRSGNRRLKYAGHLYPDFRTYNIEHHHSLEYRVVLLVGGEKEEHRFFGTPTEIISPA